VFIMRPVLEIDTCSALPPVAAPVAEVAAPRAPREATDAVPLVAADTELDVFWTEIIVALSCWPG
jgi:hypothetical protein